MARRDPVTVYACDPAKAVTCRKRSCKYDPAARFPVCGSTTHREWAAEDRDGQPVVLLELPGKQSGDEIPDESGD